MGAGLAAAVIPAPLTAWRPQPRSATRNGCATDVAFTQPLFVPGREGSLGRLTLGSSTLHMRPTPDADTLAFVCTDNGRRFTNPTLIAPIGTKVGIALVDGLSEPTVSHWHGLSVDARNNGNGETLIPPGPACDASARVPFRVLERETSPEQLAPIVVDDKGRLATDLGWKDTVLVWPGESVRIAVDVHHPFVVTSALSTVTISSMRTPA